MFQQHMLCFKENVMFKVGQKVWCVINGEGVVVNKIMYRDRHVLARFKRVVDGSRVIDDFYYTIDGRFFQKEA